MTLPHILTAARVVSTKAFGAYMVEEIGAPVVEIVAGPAYAI
jgi:hypothetical protein